MWGTSATSSSSSGYLELLLSRVVQFPMLSGWRTDAFSADIKTMCACAITQILTQAVPQVFQGWDRLLRKHVCQWLCQKESHMLRCLCHLKRIHFHIDPEFFPNSPTPGPSKTPSPLVVAVESEGEVCRSQRAHKPQDRLHIWLDTWNECNCYSGVCIS